MTAAAPTPLGVDALAGLTAAERLARVMLLQQRAAAAAAPAEIRLLLVNETASLVAYRSAFLCDADGRCRAVSALPAPNRDAPLTQLAERIARHCQESYPQGGVFTLDAAPPALAAAAEGLWRGTAAWTPLRAAADGPDEGGLLLLRDPPWSEGELRLLRPWVDFAALALAARRRSLWPWARRSSPRKLRRRAVWAAAGLALLGLLAAPVPQTVLAPAEVVAQEPDIVRAPLSGVVEEVLIQPNQAVKAGQAVARLDARELTTRQDVARQALEIAQAELRQAQQSAIAKIDAQNALPILRGRVEQRRAELQLVDSQLARVTLTAGRDGVALLPDPSVLRGRPVRQGEKLFTIADPAAVELEIWIAASDMIEIGPGSPAALFLTVAPDRRVTARLRLLSHQAQTSPDNVMGFRAVAVFDDAPPRIGLRGSARISGPSVPLALYLFRRPFAALRQQVGL